MRMPRVRFTVRGMMVAVGLVAICISVEMSRRHWVAYRDHFRMWARLEAAYLAHPEPMERGCSPSPSNPPQEARALAAHQAQIARLVAYCGALRRKYAR